MGSRVAIALAAAAATAAALCVSALPASASSAVKPAPPPLHVISLRAAFDKALRTTTAGPPAGIVPPRGTRLTAAALPTAAASCKEPECDVSYGGGPVQTSPHVYLLLWGSWWSTAAAGAASKYLSDFYSGLGVSPDDTWSTITSQYGDTTGSPTFSGSVFEGSWIDKSTPPDPVTPTDLAAEAASFASEQGISDLADAQVVVASQTGTCFSDGFAGNCGSPDSNGSYCGWHDYAADYGQSVDVPFINLPYQPDAGADCGENWVNAGSAGTFDGFSTVGGHEYAETTTDPEPSTGWIDPNDTISGGEIADKCVWGGSDWGSLGSDPYGDVTLSTGKYAMQSLWSNAAGRCVMTTSPQLTVGVPGTVMATLGVRASVQVTAATNTGIVAYRASGLPPGLSISGSGRIAGTPGVTAGTFTAKITVSDYAVSDTVTSRWLVGSMAGPVKGYKSRCADDYDGRTRNGNKIDLWSCDGKARQKITFTSSGELRIEGKCVTSGSHGVAIEPCTGSAAQTWTRRASGEYVSAGRCLTDPGDSVQNGTQLRVLACTGAAAQRWSLP